MRRDYLSKVEFVIGDANFGDTWESVTGQLYEEGGEEHVYIKRDYLEDVLDSNVVEVKFTADLNVSLDSEIDLSDIDELNFSIDNE